jgi:hypothetical protein
MFNCKVCAEKDKRVSNLESEITFLRAFIRPNVPRHSLENQAQDIEADAVLGGHTNQIVIDEKSQYIETYLPRLSKEEEEIAAERDAVLNGTY